MTATIERVLVPLALAPGTRAIVDHAVLLGRALGASLTLLHVVETPSEMIGIVPGASADDELSAELHEGLRVLDALADEVRAAGVARVATELATGPIAPAILWRANQLTAELVVMGSRWNSALSAFVHGSIAEQILRRADCPVLVVRTHRGPP